MMREPILRRFSVNQPTHDRPWSSLTCLLRLKICLVVEWIFGPVPLTTESVWLDLKKIEAQITIIEVNKTFSSSTTIVSHFSCKIKMSLINTVNATVKKKLWKTIQSTLLAKTINFVSLTVCHEEFHEENHAEFTPLPPVDIHPATADDVHIPEEHQPKTHDGEEFLKHMYTFLLVIAVEKYLILVEFPTMALIQIWSLRLAMQGALQRWEFPVSYLHKF